MSGEGDNDSVCYGSGSIAAAVIVTIIVLCFLLLVLYLVWKRWRDKKDKNLVLESDPEKGKASYAFDNDGFTDGSTPFNQTFEKPTKLDSAKSKWNQWSPISVFLTKNEKLKTVDDSVIQAGETKTVSLKSHDFTGLGFNIYGNMREGIFIKDVLNRGPAFESGKLNPGDRIKSVTINFEHVVFEDALTILSYASPYDVIVEAQSGKITTHHTPSRVSQLGHPLYRSSSATDIILIEKTAKKRLFVPDDINTKTPSSNSTLQKTRSNVTTLERKPSHSPKPEHHNLKTQLEQKLVENHKQQLQHKEEIVENDVPKIENKHHKFGIKVLPLEIGAPAAQISPKTNELSQNDNNINMEIHSDKNGVAVELKDNLDEVDKIPPPIKKREKNKNISVPDEEEIVFIRQASLNGSGIKRDKDGIPQEIPNHMLNAAVAARKNRRASSDDADDVKSPKKLKGRAPAPPDSKLDADKLSSEYVSDSDAEIDNQSSVNTIELNPNDITIHQSEEVEELQNRKTASTGDLTKIQKNRKISSGTLERAQSLDITDTGMPSLTKKIMSDSKSESEDSLYGKVLIEPRLSLVLDGLNTFQRSRLKKSTEWGNLEDAILNLDTSEGDLNQSNSLEQSPHFDALVNKINEIKKEVVVVNLSTESMSLDEVKIELTEEPQKVNDLWSVPNSTDEIDTPLMTSTTSITLDQGLEAEKEPVILNAVDIADFLTSERSTSSLDPYYTFNKYDTNVSDDIKVSRHSLTSSEKPFDSLSNISNITINSTSVSEHIPNSEMNLDSDEFYITALDKTATNDSFINDEPAVSKNMTVTEISNKVTIEGPTSLTVQVNESELTPPEPSHFSNTKSISISPSPISDNSQQSNNYSLTYITEIQVTPNTTEEPESIKSDSPTSVKLSPIIDKLDAEKELHKIQEIAEEQLKKLPEMRFSTSSYESPKLTETYSSQIEQLRSNFEKSPSKSSLKFETGVVKSRIPVATTKTPPTSPERRDSRNFDMEIDKDIVAIMSSPIHSTPVSSLKYQPKTTNKNISVTSIRSNSKIPSGLPNRPPIPPRKYDGDSENLTRISTNGNSSFKQWVFNPGDNTVTNITVSENKFDRK
ncbi:hypothetical protein RN001_014461 [Aquatica leii]|uniref:PDZ domain-containing protein n=1 Tax=Aquatica leii TaxID=1421715 RepID=A0AAN7SBG0_9COLE|nr:hypothetical protein RN001_014461 [Aquatica leii]